MSDEEEEFQYSDDEQVDVDADDVTVQVENAYHQAKDARDNARLDEARSLFATVLQHEVDSKVAGSSADMSEWVAKALKQLVKMDFRANSFESMLANYKCASADVPGSATPRRVPTI
jgi:hypothetical protein